MPKNTVKIHFDNDYSDGDKRKFTQAIYASLAVLPDYYQHLADALKLNIHIADSDQFISEANYSERKITLTPKAFSYGDPAVINRVLLEELTHYFDSHLDFSAQHPWREAVKQELQNPSSKFALTMERIYNLLIDAEKDAHGDVILTHVGTISSKSENSSGFFSVRI